MVDPVADPGSILHVGQRGTFGPDERPVGFPLGTLTNPFGQQGDLLLGQPVGGIDRRHPPRFVPVGDPPHQFAPLGIARDNRPSPPAQIRCRPRFRIQPQPDLLGPSVRPVAGVTVLGEDRTNLPVEPNRASRGRGPGSISHVEPDEYRTQQCQPNCPAAAPSGSFHRCSSLFQPSSFRHRRIHCSTTLSAAREAGPSPGMLQSPVLTCRFRLPVLGCFGAVARLPDQLSAVTSR